MSSYLLFVVGILVLIGIYALLTMSLNLKFGVTGLIDLGVVAYFAVGAYTYVLLTAPPPSTGLETYNIGLGLPLWVGFIAAALVAGLFSFLVGIPALRLRGEYLAIATYAAAEVVQALVSNEEWLTNGVVGYSNLPQPFRGVFETGNSYQYFFLLLVAVSVVVVYWLLRRMQMRPFGRALRAVRESEDVALSVGKDVARYRMKAFVIGGIIAGFAGALYVSYTSLIVPTMFAAEVTWTAWIALVIGGSGNYRGAILGTAVLLSAQEATRFFQASADLASLLAASRFVAMGILLVLIIRFRPRGILTEKPESDTALVGD